MTYHRLAESRSASTDLRLVRVLFCRISRSLQLIWPTRTLTTMDVTDEKPVAAGTLSQAPSKRASRFSRFSHTADDIAQDKQASGVTEINARLTPITSHKLSTLATARLDGHMAKDENSAHGLPRSGSPSTWSCAASSLLSEVRLCQLCDCNKHAALTLMRFPTDAVSRFRH